MGGEDGRVETMGQSGGELWVVGNSLGGGADIDLLYCSALLF